MTANIINFSSSDFLKKVQLQDAEVIEVLVKTYTGHLLKASLGLGMTELEAHELVQTTWVAFYESAPKFAGRSHVRTYLFGILYNKFKEFLRDKKKMASHEPLVDHLDQGKESLENHFDETGHLLNAPLDPEKFILASEDLEVIKTCLDLLPAQQKMVFVLKEVDGEETTMICNIVGITRTNLGVLLYRAKNSLRLCIENKFNNLSKS
jgi:RNA polymerase sigma-70 factor (ECF subfamily)